MKFKIDRNKWIRGEAESMLYRANDDKMCCLGFFMESCGIKKYDMRGLGAPSSLPEMGCGLPLEAKFLTVENDENFFLRASDTECVLILVNDDINCDDATRERQITKLFAENGHEVEFV